jgi:hypothetical protein
MAVFFTPAMISGIPSMKYSPIAARNVAVGAVYVLPVGAAACGTGTVSAGEQDGASRCGRPPGKVLSLPQRPQTGLQAPTLARPAGNRAGTAY